MASAKINTSLEIDIVTDATATNTLDYVVPRGGTVTDIRVIANNAEPLGTVTVSKAGAALTSAALNAFGAGTVVRVGGAITLTQANVTFAKGDVLRIVKSANAIVCRVVVTFTVAGPNLAAA